jgi:glycosyltransferase involved in cell wall biosynthesis
LVLTATFSEDDLRGLYALAEMFVFPSFYEGFGSAGCRSVGFWLPVIASTAPSLKEVAGSAAIFVDPKSPPEEWSRAMVRVAESAELRHSLAIAGQEQARQFSWETCAQRTSEVLRSVCRGQGMMKTALLPDRQERVYCVRWANLRRASRHQRCAGVSVAVVRKRARGL